MVAFRDRAWIAWVLVSATAPRVACLAISKSDRLPAWLASSLMSMALKALKALKRQTCNLHWHHQICYTAIGRALSKS